MASFKQYTASGGASEAFSIKTFTSDEIKVYVDGALKSAGTHYNITSYTVNGGTVTWTEGNVPSSGTVRIVRDTGVTTARATYSAGSSIKAGDLNDNQTQALRSLEEQDDQLIQTYDIEDGAIHTTKIADDAITGNKILAGTIGTSDLADSLITTAKIADANVTTAKIADNAVTMAKLNSGTLPTDITVASANLVDGTIATADIADDAVTTAKIADSNVTTAKIADSNVTTAKIADANVTTAKIADNAVTLAKLNSGALPTDITVASANLVDGTVATADIANDAITNAKIADNSIDSEHYVDGSIDTAHLADNSVTGAKLAAGTIGTSDLADSGVTTAKIAADAITAAKIADDAVDSEHLAADSIDTEHYAPASIDNAALMDGAVTLSKMADDSVGASEIVAGAVGQGELASNAVITVKIADDAVTSAKIVDNAVTIAKIADAELTTLAGMQAGTASILADSTALAATTAEINKLCDGMDYETTISNTDVKYPTSGAVIDYVAAQIAPIGGLEVIATDAAFPNTQPSAGVVISIADAGGLVVNGSGTSTTGRTVGGSTVTINGINSSYNSSTVTAGVGFLVSSTGSGQIYNFHKSVIRDQDILSISTDIDDFANRYRVHNGEPSSNNDDGDLVWDTNANKMKVYDATASAWTEVTSTGDFKYLFLCPAGGSGAPTLNGSIATYDLRESSNSGSAASVNSAAQLIVSVNGVIQKANTGTSAPAEGFALVDANTIIFGANLVSGDSVFIVQIGSAVSIPTPGDNTVSTAKIQNLAVTGDKVATNLDLADDKKIRFGTSQDAEIYHSGSAAYMQNVTGFLFIHGNDIALRSVSGENYIVCDADQEVELYYDGSKKLETTSTGTNTVGTHVDDGANHDGDVNFYGVSSYNAQWDKSDASLKFLDNAKIKIGTGDDIQIYHNGTDSYVDNSTGDMWYRTNGAMYLFNKWDTEYYIKCNPNTSVDLYYNGVKKFETTSQGALVTGKLELTGNLTGLNGAFFADNKKASFGNGDDLEIYHDGTTNWIDAVNNHGTVLRAGTGILYLQGSEIHMGDEGGNEVHIKTVDNGRVELYYDGAKKIETAGGGINITGDSYHNTDNGSSYYGADNDLQIYHDGSHGWLKNTTGNLYINGKGAEVHIAMVPDAGVELRYNDVKKFETQGGGIKISGGDSGGSTIIGDVFFDNGNQAGKDIDWDQSTAKWRFMDDVQAQWGTGQDLRLYHASGNSYIENVTGELVVNGDTIHLKDGGNNETLLKAVKDGAVELYYDNTLKFETVSQGIKVKGNENDGAVIEIFADEGDDNEDKWRLTSTTDGWLHIQSYKFGNWHPALSCFGGGSEIQRPYIQAGVSGVRFDRDQASPTADQWDEYTADGTLHRSWGQAYITADDHLRVRKNGNAENRRFDFRTDTGNAEALNDFLDDQFDFAEFFEWSDGNPDGEDRIGHTVAVDGLTGKIKIATEGDAVIGVVSGTAAFTANCAAMGWHGKYIRDEWGRYRFDLVKDKDGNQLYRDENKKHEKVTLVENPDWDKSKEYYSRDERKEWDKIGIIGQCYVRKTAVIPSSWIKLKEVDSTKDFYLIK